MHPMPYGPCSALDWRQTLGLMIYTGPCAPKNVSSVALSVLSFTYSHAVGAVMCVSPKGRIFFLYLEKLHNNVMAFHRVLYRGSHACDLSQGDMCTINNCSQK